ncbi:hypothetical protein NQ318_010212 [Aromia moschata]|uniref:Uncharacterized protein n=1 Tax=Aromia moschata TaxID=1265417 RepID=A0AAV8Y364_9CUCU|nr:hypothetical protein NQ318_010212 [Aromia moschata]
MANNNNSHPFPAQIPERTSGVTLRSNYRQSCNLFLSPTLSRDLAASTSMPALSPGDDNRGPGMQMQISRGDSSVGKAPGEKMAITPRAKIRTGSNPACGNWHLALSQSLVVCPTS